MSRLSIFARLVLLAVVLLSVLVGTSLYLTRELHKNSATLVEQGEALALVETADRTNKAFGDLKYWLADLAVSLLVRAEQKATEARAALEGQLDLLEAYDPGAVGEIRAEVDALVTQSLQAVEAYTDGNRVTGNALMAVARQHIAAVDERLSELVAKVGARSPRAAPAGAAPCPGGPLHGDRRHHPHEPARRRAHRGHHTLDHGAARPAGHRDAGHHRRQSRHRHPGRGPRRDRRDGAHAQAVPQQSGRARTADGRAGARRGGGASDAGAAHRCDREHLPGLRAVRPRGSTDRVQQPLSRDPLSRPGRGHYARNEFRGDHPPRGRGRADRGRRRPDRCVGRRAPRPASRPGCADFAASGRRSVDPGH